MLFNGKEHETVRFDYYQKTIDNIIKCWNEDMTYKEICKKFGLKQVEFALIALDLQMSGKLNYREGGFWGKDK